MFLSVAPWLVLLAEDFLSELVHKRLYQTIVLLIHGKGYVWYINSGFKRAVDTVKPTLGFLTDTSAELGKKAPSHVLSHLRQACKAYLAHLPGSGLLIDRGFDALDDVVDAHADEANAIIGAARRPT